MLVHLVDGVMVAGDVFADGWVFGMIGGGGGVLGIVLGVVESIESAAFMGAEEVYNLEEGLVLL